MKIHKDIFEQQQTFNSEDFEINVRLNKQMLDKLNDCQVDRLLDEEFKAAKVTVFQFIMAQRFKDNK